MAAGAVANSRVLCSLVYRPTLQKYNDRYSRRQALIIATRNAMAAYLYSANHDNKS